jgi:hypothetical protein
VCLLRGLGGLPATLIDLNQPGAPVVGIGYPTHVAHALEFVDEAGGTLLGHLGLLGQVGQPRPAGRDALKDTRLGECHVVEPGVSDGLQNAVLHMTVGDEQQHAEVDRGFLHIVRIPDYIRTVDAETSWRVIEQQRLSLADLLEGLTDEQWNSPTLWAMAGELARARGSLETATRDMAVRYAERPGADLVAEIREHAASRRLPRVTNYRNIVLDILVHGQDIAVPLGISREMPKDGAVAALDRAWTIAWLLGVKGSLKRFRYTATDVDWSAGDGHEVTGPAAALLLLLTGRPAGLAQLSGPGLGGLPAALRR